MPTWKEELARRIAALKDDDWDKTPLSLPTGRGEDRVVLIRTKTFVIPAPPVGRHILNRLLGTVNFRETCGASTETLFIAGCDFARHFPDDQPDAPEELVGTMTVVLREIPWNSVIDSCGKVRRLKPAPFPAIDFEEIPVSNYFYIRHPDGRIVPAPDVLAWGRWFENADRIIVQDELADPVLRETVLISTTFLGFDHSLGRRIDPSPILFETMIFGGRYDQEMWRYATEDAARRGHARAMAMVRDETGSA